MVRSGFVDQQIQIIFFSFAVRISLITIEYQYGTQHHIPPVHIPVTRFSATHQSYINKTLEYFNRYTLRIFPNLLQVCMRMPAQIIKSKIIHHCRVHRQIVMYLFIIIIPANASRLPTTATAT